MARDGRDLKRIVRQRVFGPNFHHFFNPSPNSKLPPLDSIIPTQVKTHNYLCSEDRENTGLAALGALAHRLQRRTACNTSPPAESKMANGVWK